MLPGYLFSSMLCVLRTRCANHPIFRFALPSNINTYAQAKFTADQHPQYIYSPRELSRWVRALYEAMNPLDAMTLDELVRLWANEALRLFHDRLVTQEERDWCQDKVRLLLLLFLLLVVVVSHKGLMLLMLVLVCLETMRHRSSIGGMFGA